MVRSGAGWRLAGVVGALLLAAGAGGCDTGFESPEIVLDLRVLGVEAEPPEVVTDVDPERPWNATWAPVTLTALVADPYETRGLGFAMRACPPTRSLRCDDEDAPVLDLGSGLAGDPEVTGGGDVRGLLEVEFGLLEAAVRADDLEGFGGVKIQVEIRIAPEGAPEQEVVASKFVLFSPRLPPERVANTNPTMIEILADGVPWPPGRCGETGPTLEVAPEQIVELQPVEGEGARETYVVPTFDGGARTFTEYLVYSWFATAGSFSPGRSGGPTDLFGNVPLTRTRWRAPAEPQEAIPFWIVQRDERGGTSWTERCLRVR